MDLMGRKASYVMRDNTHRAFRRMKGSELNGDWSRAHTEVLHN